MMTTDAAKLEAHNKRMKEAFEQARGRWTELLVQLGVDKKVVNGVNQPCPLCGGEDRFQYTDKYSNGNYVCRKCGPGQGFQLYMGITGLRAGEALRKVEEQLGILPATSTVAPRTGPTEQEQQRTFAEVLKGCRPIRRGDPVDRYLCSLGLGMDVYPDALLCHRRLGYYEKPKGKDRSEKVGEYAALISKVTMPDGRLGGLHRTYLLDGAKAPVPSPKKMLGTAYEGGAVRLAEAEGTSLGAGEGLENSLAVMQRTGAPIWSALNAWNLEKIWVPDHVEHFTLYGDNDADGDFTGQVAVYTRARDFVRERERVGRKCTADVHVPKVAGTDWKEVYRHAQQRNADGQPRLKVVGS